MENDDIENIEKQIHGKILNNKRNIFIILCKIITIKSNNVHIVKETKLFFLYFNYTYKINNCIYNICVY